MSIKVTIFYQDPTGAEEIPFEPDTVIQTIETCLDDMAGIVHDIQGIDAYRELLIRVENVPNNEAK